MGVLHQGRDAPLSQRGLITVESPTPEDTATMIKTVRNDRTVVFGRPSYLLAETRHITDDFKITLTLAVGIFLL